MKKRHIIELVVFLFSLLFLTSCGKETEIGENGLPVSGDVMVTSFHVEKEIMGNSNSKILPAGTKYTLNITAQFHNTKKKSLGTSTIPFFVSTIDTNQVDFIIESCNTSQIENKEYEREHYKNVEFTYSLLDKDIEEELEILIIVTTKQAIPADYEFIEFYFGKNKASVGFVSDIDTNYLVYSNNAYNEDPLQYEFDRTEGCYYVSGMKTKGRANVNIRSHVAGYPVSYIVSNAISNDNAIEKINIPETVTIIYEYAFINLKNLKDITIPESVEDVGKGILSGCKNIQNLTVPSLYFGYESMMTYLFVNPYGKTTSPSYLSKITILSGDEIPANCFMNMKRLEVVNLPETLTSIGDCAFMGCKNLTSINIPDSVSYIGYSAFSQCTNLNSIRLPKALEEISDSAFYYCKYLKTVEVNSTIKNIGEYAFNGCSSLKEFTFNDGLKSIGAGAFSGCSKLKNVSLPMSVTSVGYGAFANCSSLKTFEVLNPNARLGAGALFKCSDLKTVTVPLGTKEEDTMSFSELFTSDSKKKIPSSLKTITITSMAYVPQSCFEKFSNVETIVLPDNLNIIEAYAFYGCNSLKTLNIPKSVTSIGVGAFEYCQKLTSITLPEGLTVIESYTFNSCYALNEISLPNSLVQINDYAFKDCDKITSMILPDRVNFIGNYAFTGMDSLTEVAIPKNVSYIGVGCFYDTYKLKTVTLPLTSTMGEKYSFREFFKNEKGKYRIPTKLKEVYVTNVNRIVEHCFYGFSSITKIELLEGCEVIESYAFQDCSKLAEITIPKTVIEIGWSAFNNCSKLQTIYFNGTQDEWNSIDKGYAFDKSESEYQFIYNKDE